MILPLEQQVTSLELSRELKELGVRQDTAYVWYTNGPHVSLLPCPDGLRPMESKTYSAYTLAELLHLLPSYILTEGVRKWLSVEKVANEYEAKYQSSELEDGYMGAMQPANACARMLIYLIKNNLIDVSSLGEEK